MALGIQPHEQVKFEDLSGLANGAVYSNPYDALIESSNNSIVRGIQHEIQQRYSAHRTKRNAQQREKLCDASFPGVLLDPVLQRLHDPETYPGFADERHCLVLWARPPQRLRALIGEAQRRLLAAAPRLWLMPSERLHMTALEVAHSRTREEIDALVAQIRPQVHGIVNITQRRRACLHSPLLSYDAQGVALSFLPAAPPQQQQQQQQQQAATKGGNGPEYDEDGYSYHHLRRDLYAAVGAAGIEVGSRYVVPSAHLTVARFIDARDFQDKDGASSQAAMERFVAAIEEVNSWLAAEYWPQDERGGLQWVVGEEKGLDCREGTLWYGGGETVQLGEGF